MEVTDKGANAGEVVGIEGSRGCRSSGMDLWMSDGMIFGAEREAPKFDAGGLLPSFE